MSALYSIIIPAYNEQQWLPATLASLGLAMQQQGEQGEVIVCDNNSSDATAELARQWGAQVVFEPHNQISRARNSGAREARGRYLIFVDADTRITPELLQAALHRLQSGECCGGGALVELEGGTPGRGERLGLWAWNQLSTHLHLAAGCFVFCLREDFVRLGGFSEAVYASEELWFSRRMHRQGRRRGMPFCIIRQYPAYSSGRKSQWYGRGRQLLLLSMLLLFPWLLRYRRFCGFWYRRPEQ